MAIKALDPMVPIWWTPESEAKSENPTRFRIKPLTGIQRIEVNTDTKMTGRGLVISAAGIRTALRYGLVGWENFNNADGPVVFSFDVDENLAVLPEGVILKLVDRILTASSVSEEAKKN